MGCRRQRLGADFGTGSFALDLSAMSLLLETFDWTGRIERADLENLISVLSQDSGKLRILGGMCGVMREQEYDQAKLPQVA